MVDVSTIKDRESLEAWLETRAPEEAAAIASRVALRVLPIMWLHEFREADDRDLERLLTLLRACLRHSLSPGLVGWHPNESEIALERKLRGLAGAQSTFAPRGAEYSNGLALGAALNVANASRARLYCLDAVQYASEAAATASREGAVIWDEVLNDALVIASGEDVKRRQLYSSESFILTLGKGQRLRHLNQGLPYRGVWRFFIEWYESMLDPAMNPPNWGLYEQVALIDPEIWDAGGEAVSEKIAEIQERFGLASETADPMELIAAQQLMHAALGDFSFDQAARLMRMVPFAEDIKFLENPEKVSAFLADATEMIDEIELYSSALKREGAAMQGAGFVSSYLDSLSEEFSKIRQTQKLNIGKIVKLGEFLQTACLDEQRCAEFGDTFMKPLKQIVEDLLKMTRVYFGETLLRFAPLDELELEADTSAWEYLHEVRCAMRDFADPAKHPDVALASEDASVLNSLADEIERVLRGMDNASPKAVSSFQRELNYKLALLTVTTSLFLSRSKQAAGGAFKNAEALLKKVKIAKGIKELWDLVFSNL